MTSDILVAIITGVIGLIVGSVMTYLRSQKELEIEYDKELRRARVEFYSKLWKELAVLAKYDLPKPKTTTTLAQLSKEMRVWYFDTGGMYLSEESREPYFELKKALEQQIKGSKFLFSVELKYQDELNDGRLSRAFRNDFKSHDIKFARAPTIEAQVIDGQWRIIENGAGPTYIVSKEGEALNIYERKLLFSVELKYQDDLKAGRLSAAFRDEFESRGIALARKLTIETQVIDGQWRIIWNDTGPTYIVYKEGEALNIYDGNIPDAEWQALVDTASLLRSSLAKDIGARRKPPVGDS